LIFQIQFKTKNLKEGKNWLQKC